MNPPTVGHEKLVNKIVSTAIAEKGTPLVYLSKTQDAKKNPLTYDQKIKYAQTFFGKRLIVKSNAKTIIQVAQELQKAKYKDLVLVVGSDRVKEFETLLNKYNGKDYTFNSIKVVSAGERDPDSDDVSGMSASKIRAAAADGDLDLFTKGIPTRNDRMRLDLYRDVRSGLGISESLNFAVDQFLAERVKAGKVDPLSAMGKQKLTGAEVATYYKNNPKSKSAAARDKNVKLGIELALDLAGNMNYAVKEIDKLKRNLSKHPEVQKALRSANESSNIDLYRAASIQERMQKEADKESKQQKQQPGYYKDLGGSTKDKRQAHFNKKSKMDDDNPDAYDKAPGDAEAKTKPSKHTQKYKKMFGELRQDLLSKVKESTDIGQDYAKHTSTITPGEPDFAGYENPTYKPSQPGSGESIVKKKIKGFLEKETEQPSEKDVKEWASAESTIDKYRERYKTEWKTKLQEVVDRMIAKL